jgi:hypothetical protein
MLWDTKQLLVAKNSQNLIWILLISLRILQKVVITPDKLIGGTNYLLN